MAISISFSLLVNPERKYKVICSSIGDNKEKNPIEANFLSHEFSFPLSLGTLKCPLYKRAPLRVMSYATGNECFMTTAEVYLGIQGRLIF